MKRTPIRSMSAKRRAKLGAYRKARLFVEARCHGRCEARLVGCDGTGDQAHHVLRRSQGGPDTPENLLWCCSTCHQNIHANPERSFAMGLLRRAAS